jgi:tRNA-splicing ligase RtcB
MKEEKTTNSAAPDEIEGEKLDWETPVRQPKLHKYLNNLAWLGRERSEGLEYWKSMELMGRGVSANHDIIQQSVLNHPGTVSVLTLEKHHRFIWKMQCGDEEVIVHRKGATSV